MIIHAIYIGGENKVKINRIAINGFKNIQNVNICFDKITSMLSVNSYGKSNFLTGIDFGISFIKCTKEAKKRMMGYAPGFPLNKSNLLAPFTFEIELTMDHEIASSVIYSFSFEWKSAAGIVSENLKMKKEDELKFTTYIQRDGQEKKYKSSLTGRCDKEITIGNDELIINKISNFDDLFYIDIIRMLNDINVYVERHFDASVPFTPFPYIEKDIDELKITDEKNIPRVLYNIKITDPNKYKKIVNTIHDIFPFITDLIIREIKIDEKNIDRSSLPDEDYYQLIDKIYLLYAVDKNLVKQISFSEMSDGVRRVLLVLTYIVLAQMNQVSLIAIEEPENSLNPGILKKYITALDSFIEDTTILITSHSPYLINYMNTNSLYIGLPNDEGMARFRKIKASSVNKLYKDADDLDMLVGEYLFDLLSESTANTDTLHKYLHNE